MWRFLSKWRWAAVVVILLAITASIYATSYARAELTVVERLLRDFTAPIASGFTRTAQTISSFFSTISNLGTLASKNQALERENDALRSQVSELEEYGRQNRVLRRALEFEESQEENLLAAEVIGRKPISWYNHIIINRGSKNGVKAGMAVVAPGGVVGQVRAVTAKTAEVMLVLDSRSVIGGRIKRNDELVLVEGQSSNPEWGRVRSLVRESDLQEGDEVVTSGLSQVFPGGVPIGRIVEVKMGPYGISRTGRLEPGVDFSHLEVVFVLVEP